MVSLGRHQVTGLLLILVYMCSHGKDITKELYRHHYKPFETYVFDKRALVNCRKTPIIGDALVQAGARVIGYDDFAIERIHFTYSLCDRSDDDLKNLLCSLESDECIGYANLLLKRSREKPGDLNWIVRVTHEEGNRLEQEKIKKTGRAASQQEKDTFIAIGFFVRYLVKNKGIE